MQTEKNWPHSSNIIGTKYNLETKVLEVEFKSHCHGPNCKRNIYQYSDVPAELWLELIAATSVGSFISERVKGKFKFVKL